MISTHLGCFVMKWGVSAFPWLGRLARVRRPVVKPFWLCEPSSGETLKPPEKAERFSRGKPIAMCLIVWVVAGTPLRAQTAPATQAVAQVMEQSSVPTVGTEGRVEVVLPWEDVVPREADSKSELVVRVAGKRVWGTGWRYDLRWVAAVPGKHDLIRALRRESAEESWLAAQPVVVEAASVLPESHDGALIGVGNEKVGGVRWYWTLAAVVGLGWVALLVPGALRRWRERKLEPVAVIEHRPTLADRLRPLLAAAANGELDADGQGKLERLLLQVWRQRLGLENVRPAEGILRMKQDPQAGELLRALEGWLHLPPGRARGSEGEINRLLSPYAQMPDLEAVRG
jgi:hypothetical protein